jgi:phosphoglycolate phosphatase-like HAD superfamily hydrolase
MRGVILDIDGTLIDSNRAHAESWQRALADEGLRFPVDQIQKLIGMGGDKLLPTLTGIREDSERGKKISRHRGEIFRTEYLPRLKVFPKAKELLRKMRASGLKLSVATSGNREDFEALLKNTGLDQEIPGPKVTKEQARETKPEPDSVEMALDELELPPAEVLMLGDTPYDIHAAKMARVKTVALRCGGWSDDGLQGAIAIYDDPADLLAHWDESPFAAAAAEQRRVG